MFSFLLEGKVAGRTGPANHNVWNLTVMEKSCLFAVKGFQHFGVYDFFGFSVAEDGTVETGDAVGVLGDDSYIVGNDEDGRSLVFESQEKFIKALVIFRIDGRCRLVAEKNLRLHTQSSGDESPLSFSSREVPKEPIPERSKVYFFYCFVHHFPIGSLRPFSDADESVSSGENKFLQGYGEVGIKMGKLWDVSDSVAKVSEFLGLSAQNIYFSSLRNENAENDFEKRRFPGTIWSNEGDKLSLLNHQGNVFKNRGIII